MRHQGVDLKDNRPAALFHLKLQFKVVQGALIWHPERESATTARRVVCEARPCVGMVVALPATMPPDSPTLEDVVQEHIE